MKNGPLNLLEVKPLPTCKSCLEGKMTKRLCTRKCQRVRECLELVHTDVCGPLNVQAQGGFEYFIIVTDDNSDMVTFILCIISLRHLKDLDNSNSRLTYESCLEGKMTEKLLTGKGQRVQEYLELVHTDVCRTLNVQARGGFEYFITFTDDHSRYSYIF